MPWYKCFIRGENFPLEIRGAVRPTGFFTTRFVEADSVDDAELRAVDLLRGDSTLDVPATRPGRENARLYVEEITEVEGPGTPNAGFTFFRDD